MPARPSRMGSPTDVKNGQRTAAPFHPPADTTTFKDLLLFEERLKMNAEMLRRRKRRYEAFLVVLIGTISFLAHRTVVQPPEHAILKYLVRGLFAVSLVTLVLFYASGMYEERIRYANRYVPHANRSLRSINMHLNMRRAPRSALSYIPFLPRSASSSPAPTSRSTSPALSTASTAASGKSKPAPGSAAGAGPGLQVIPPIPPTSNPRGELIFSSRVDRGFKDGYERYRAAFEKRREEKMREGRRGRGWGWAAWGRGGGGGTGQEGAGRAGTGGKSGSGASTPMSPTGSAQGRLASADGPRRPGTPPSLASRLAADLEGGRPASASRRSSASSASSASRSREPSPASVRLASFSAAAAAGADGRGAPESKPGNRDRAESYSFILGRAGAPGAEADGRGRGAAGGGGEGRLLLGRIAEGEAAVR